MSMEGQVGLVPVLVLLPSDRMKMARNGDRDSTLMKLVETPAQWQG
jgi:hypothetical protein